MQMSYGEIIRSYKEAKDARKQIGVLAELNAVSRAEIAKILLDAGMISKTTYGQYRRHIPKAGASQADTCDTKTPPKPPVRELPKPPASAETATAPVSAVPEAVLEMIESALREMRPAYERAKTVVTQYEEMRAFLNAASAAKKK